MNKMGRLLYREEKANSKEQESERLEDQQDNPTKSCQKQEDEIQKVKDYVKKDEELEEGSETYGGLM